MIPSLEALCGAISRGYGIEGQRCCVLAPWFTAFTGFWKQRDRTIHRNKPMQRSVSQRWTRGTTVLLINTFVGSVQRRPEGWRWDHTLD